MWMEGSDCSTQDLSTRGGVFIPSSKPWASSRQGSAVLTTGSGGAIELAERAELPLFPKDHPFALSRLLAALEEDRARVADIGLRGQETMLREFTLHRMLEKTSRALGRLVDESRTFQHQEQPNA